MAQNKNKIKDLSYEESVKRLDEIVALLSDGKASLDESLGLFEEGCALTSHCSDIIKNAKAKITEIEKDS